MVQNVDMKNKAMHDYLPVNKLIKIIILLNK